MLSQYAPQLSRSKHPVAWIACGLLLTSLVSIGARPAPAQAQQPAAPAAMPQGALSMAIEVAQLRGLVSYTRRVGQRTRVRTVTRATKLLAGDTLHLDIGARCLLLFKNPPQPNNDGNANRADVGNVIRPVAYSPEAPSTQGDAVAAAVLFRGYSEVSIAIAYHHNQAATIQLDMPQGIARAGIVPSAVKPRFRIRTPRTVVAVRGTEIRELETSVDRGDILSMGRTGVVATKNSGGPVRSAQAEQGTRKTNAADRRAGRLVRAINDMIVRTRLVIAGPHRSRMEYDQASRETRDAYGFGTADKLKSNGNPAFSRFLNSGTTYDGGKGNQFGGGGGSSGSGSQ